MMTLLQTTENNDFILSYAELLNNTWDENSRIVPVICPHKTII